MHFNNKSNQKNKYSLFFNFYKLTNMATKSFFVFVYSSNTIVRKIKTYTTIKFFFIYFLFFSYPEGLYYVLSCIDCSKNVGIIPVNSCHISDTISNNWPLCLDAHPAYRFCKMLQNANSCIEVKKYFKTFYQISLT